ncbi:MAG: CotH kinase family protein [Verrucomicrobia bacterium]|nr:CotH kinase family protein [Verrucomicrobiota bacterium]
MPPARAWIPGDNSLGQSWISPDFNDSSWKSGSTGVGYDYPGLTGLDVSEMRNVNESVYIRVKFSLSRIPTYSRLVLRMQYEDGVAVFLNGSEIVRDNAPASLTWNSGAPQNRPDNIALIPIDFDITPHSPLLKTGENILAIHGLNNLVTSSDILFRPQIIGIGESENGGYGYSYKPSRREPNGEVYPAMAPSVVYSQPGTSFLSPISLTLTIGAPATDGMEIRYTLNGTIPTPSSTLYTSPIRLSQSSVVTSRVFGKSGSTGPVAREIYSLIHSSAADFSSNLPLMVLDAQGFAGIPSFGLLPVYLSIFEPDATGRTRLTTPPVVQSSAGIRDRGSSTAGRPKPSLNLELWDPYGNDQNLSLLGMPAESDWILWGPYNFDPTYLRNPLIYELSNQIGSYAVRTRFVELYLNLDGNQVDSGDYHGVYVLMEKITRDADRVDVERLFPEHNQEPYISGGYIFKIDRPDPGDGGFSVPGQNVLYVEPKEEEMETNERASQRQWVSTYFRNFVTSTTNRTRPTPTYHNFLDVNASIDHHLLNVLAFNVDALRLSTYMHLPRNGKLTFGPIWDFDRSQGSTDGRDSNPAVWRSQNGDLGTDFFNYPWWSNLFQDLEFFQLYIDRWQDWNAGPLSLTHIRNVIDSMANAVREASVRNEQRWGTFRSPFNTEISRMKTWYTQRINFINSQFVDRPTITATPSTDGKSFIVTMTSPDGGNVYYTTDGSDPRQIGGTPSSQARIYSTPVTVNETVSLMARAFNSQHRAVTGANNPPLASQWSGPVIRRLAVHEQPRQGDLIISEIQYHPYPPTPTERINDPALTENDFEYLEISNISQSILDIGELTLQDGIDFQFSTGSIQTLAPGESVLIVSNRSAFSKRYTSTSASRITGVFSRSLSNSGEWIRLTHPQNGILFETDYRDGWFPLTDGVGFSLVPSGNQNASPSDKSWWRQSQSIHGSAGQTDPEPLEFPRVVVHEFLAHSDLPLVDTIEIYNASDTAVQIGGWYLSDNSQEPYKFQIPTPTVIESRGYWLVDESQFNLSPPAQIPFSLSATGEQIFLFAADQNGQLTGYYDGHDFSGSKSGVSFGRTRISTGQEKWAPLKTRTFGSANSEPLVGPVIISEFLYHPPDKQNLPNSEDEFVEITNPTSNPIPLFDPNLPENTWRLRGGIDFNFPPNITLAPKEVIVVLAVDPQTNPTAVESLKSIFQIPAGVRFFGPFSGNLNNAGDKISLRAPDAPQPGTSQQAGEIPYFDVDAVEYAPRSPWPINVSGSGNSVTRSNPNGFGLDPIHWIGSVPSPGIFVSSRPEIQSIQIQNGSLIIQFEAPSPGAYSLLKKSSIHTGSWIAVEDVNSQAASQIIQFNYPIPNNPTNEFFLIRKNRE